MAYPALCGDDLQARPGEAAVGELGTGPEQELARHDAGANALEAAELNERSTPN